MICSNAHFHPKRSNLMTAKMEALTSLTLEKNE